MWDRQQIYVCCCNCCSLDWLQQVHSSHCDESIPLPVEVACLVVMLTYSTRRICAQALLLVPPLSFSCECMSVPKFHAKEVHDRPNRLWPKPALGTFFLSAPTKGLLFSLSPLLPALPSHSLFQVESLPVTLLPSVIFLAPSLEALLTRLILSQNPHSFKQRCSLKPTLPFSRLPLLQLPLSFRQPLCKTLRKLLIPPL